VISKFFTTRENTAAWTIRSGYNPLRKSAADSAGLEALWQANPQAKQLFELTAYARPEPNIPAWQAIRDVRTNALTAVTTQEKSAKQALDAAAREATKPIDETR
jgi:multiple sugar transport system substrate-binding protein